MAQSHSSTPRPARADISKDTQMCISLSARPSNIGTRFHNYLYAELGLDYIYKACTTTDLAAAIGGIRALGIRGCGVSMPFKEQSIQYVNAMDASASAIGSVNTIVNTAGHLAAYNTDYLAIVALLAEHQVPADFSVAIAGSGGMAKAVVAALRDSDFSSATVIARNEDAGSRLAEQYGFRWAPELGSMRPQLLVNATPIGMSGSPDAERLSFPEDAIQRAEMVFEVVAMPVWTPLIARATELAKPVITGAEVIALQAADQFALYTGVRPSSEQIQRASEFSRA